MSKSLRDSYTYSSTRRRLLVGSLGATISTLTGCATPTDSHPENTKPASLAAGGAARVTISRFNEKTSRVLQLPDGQYTMETSAYFMAAPRPNRMQVTGEDGTVFGEIGDFNAIVPAMFTKNRSVNDQTGFTVFHCTLEIFAFARGWTQLHTNSDESWHLQLINSQGGVIVEWTLAKEELAFRCEDNGRRYFARREYESNYHDEIVGCQIVLPRGRAEACTPSIWPRWIREMINGPT